MNSASKVPAVDHRALVLYSLFTLLSFPHELPGGHTLDLGLLLAWLGPAALIVGIAGQTPRRAAWLAFCASLASHALLFHWFVIVTVRYGGMPAWLGFFAPLVPALYVSFFTALFAWLWTRVHSGLRTPVWIGAMLWVAVDWARGHFLGGFPWATLGYALHLDWPLLVWTRWAGVYVLSFIAVAVGIALGRWWLSRASAELRVLGITVAAVAAAHVVGALYSPTDLESAVPIRIAAVQGNIDQGEKWDEARREQILDTYLELSSQAAKDGAQWIVWPESAIPGLLEVESELASRIQDLARDHEVSLIVGGAGVDVDRIARRFTAFFDSAFLIDSTGVLRDRYDKTHLVPFGEYVPLPPWSGVSMEPSPYTDSSALTSLAAAVANPRYSSIIDADNKVAVGLIIFCPAMSGAVPWADSK